LQRTPHLVAIGGGHSHAIALDRWSRLRSRPPARITLISDSFYAPYSGILPGHVAGQYRWNDCYIDLWGLSRRAGADFLCDRAVGLDLKRRLVELESDRTLAYDFLSIDTGSTPKLDLDAGRRYVVPAKPVTHFLSEWYALVSRVRANPNEPIAVTIVGGGAGGVELALTASARLHGLLARPDLLTLNLVQRGDRILPGHNDSVRRLLADTAIARGIRLHCGETVRKVTPIQTVVCESGREIASDFTIWVTSATPAFWLGKSGLATDDRGFVTIDDTLRSVSHPEVFATGDVSVLRDRPLPRAGVYAVRQGAPLCHNWNTALTGGTDYARFDPPENVLALIGTGDGRAVASWGRWGIGPYRWLWAIKDWIDRRFMAKFPQLPTHEDRR